MSAQLSPVQEQEIRRLLDLSANLYTSMEQIYLTLDQQQLTDTDKVTPLLNKLEKLKEKARQVDSVLIPQIKDHKLLSQQPLTPAIKTREETIGRLIKLNSKLTENTKRYKAVIQNELSNLCRNRNALGGYKTTQQETGVIRGAY